MDELKPCPFCGGEAQIKAKIKAGVGFTIWCECKTCAVETVGYCPNMQNENSTIENIESSKRLAIKSWNRRTKE